MNHIKCAGMPVQTLLFAMVVLPSPVFIGAESAALALTISDSTGSTLINYDGIRKRIASIATLSGGMVGASGLSYEENLPTGNGLIMAYDPFGRLSQVTGTPQGMVSFTYDWAGRRGSKTVGGQTTYFLYSGNDLVCEVNSAGNVNRS